MKLFVIFAVIIAAAMAAPAADETTVLRHDVDVGVDAFNFAYETSDGVAREESGHLEETGTENKAWRVTGTISWVAPDGQKYTLRYTADETGYHPEAAHLPTGHIV